MNDVNRLVPLESMGNGSLVIACARDIKPEKVDWLWDQRLPLGKCVLFAGEGGLGKSMVLAWIAATVSRGGEWPCGEGRSPVGSIIILSAEDDAADTIVPRLMAANADCLKVHILEAVCREDAQGHRTFNLQLDLPALESKIAELRDVLLVIIDPITSYLGRVDSHKNAELRSVLEPLGKMAARLHVTLIANTHLSKAFGGNANNRVIGSVAFVNHARAVFIVTPDPEDSNRRLFLPSKTNLGKPRDGLAYRIADMALPDPEGSVIWAPYVKWDDAPVTMSADDAVSAMAGGAECKTAKAEAIDFLRAELADGPKPVGEVNKAATAAGHTPKAIRTAREALGITPQKAGMHEGWLWGLRKMPNHPPKMPNHPEDAHSRKWAPSAPEGIFDVFKQPGDRPSIGAQPPSENGKNPDRCSTQKVSTYAGNEHLCVGQVDLEERAAILEYDGGLTRAQAEALAAEEFPELPAFLDRRARP